MGRKYVPVNLASFFPELKTDHLRLVKLTKDYEGAIHSYASDEVVTRFVDWPRHLSHEDTTDFIEGWVADRYRKNIPIWAVLFEERMVGSIGFSDIDAVNLCGELGYVFHRDVWGNGFATESGKAIIEYGFDILGLHRIQACCFQQNIASARVLEKIGMNHEGTDRESYVHGDDFWSVKRYSIVDK